MGKLAIHEVHYTSETETYVYLDINAVPCQIHKPRSALAQGGRVTPQLNRTPSEPDRV